MKNGFFGRNFAAKMTAHAVGKDIKMVIGKLGPNILVIRTGGADIGNAKTFNQGQHQIHGIVINSPRKRGIFV